MKPNKSSSEALRRRAIGRNYIKENPFPTNKKNQGDRGLDSHPQDDDLYAAAQAETQRNAESFSPLGIPSGKISTASKFLLAMTILNQLSMAGAQRNSRSDSGQKDVGRTIDLEKTVEIPVETKPTSKSPEESSSKAATSKPAVTNFDSLLFHFPVASEGLSISKPYKSGNDEYIMKPVGGQMAAMHDKIMTELGMNKGLSPVQQVFVSVIPLNSRTANKRVTTPITLVGHMRKKLENATPISAEIELELDQILDENEQVKDKKKFKEIKALYSDEDLELYSDDGVFATAEFLHFHFYETKVNELYKPYIQQMMRASLFGLVDLNDPNNIFTNAEGEVFFPDLDCFATPLIPTATSTGFKYVTEQDFFDLYEYTLTDSYKKLRDEKLALIEKMQPEGKNSELYRIQSAGFAACEKNLSNLNAQFKDRRDEVLEFVESDDFQNHEMQIFGEIIEFSYDLKGKLKITADTRHFRDGEFQNPAEATLDNHPYLFFREKYQENPSTKVATSGGNTFKVQDKGSSRHSESEL